MKLRLLILTASLIVMTFGVSQGQGIYVDHVDGLCDEANGYFTDGATLTFHMRVIGDGTNHLMLNNGFTFTSAELTWGGITGEYTSAYPVGTWFDFVKVINTTDWANGSVEDTIGTGLLSLFGTGMPANFDDILYTFTIGPLTGPVNGTLVLDSSWYPPSNPWMWDVVAENVAWGGPYTYTLVEETDVAYVDGVGLPTVFALKQNYPNPFNPNTEVLFDVPRRCDVSIVVYNLLGHRVRTLVDKEMAAGTYVANWDGTNEAGTSVSSGMYFYRMMAGDFVQSKKMMLVK